MPYQIVVPEGSAPPLAPYSPGAKAGMRSTCPVRSRSTAPAISSVRTT